MKYYRQRQAGSEQGFTLIETLIAVSILVLAVTGAFAAAQNGISSATFSKDQMVAFYLAEEGVEEVRNIRDENALKGSASWLTGIAASASDPCSFGNKCMADARHNTITRCSTSGCPPLVLDQDGFYDYDQNGTTTPFERDIELKPLSDHEVSIVVTVNWSKGVIIRQFSAQENIFNWQ